MNSVETSKRLEKPKWTVGDFVGLIGGLAGLVGAIAGILAWLEAKESRRISNDALIVSQKTYDRAAGKVKASFVVEKITMAAGEIPKEFIVHSRFSNGQQLRLTSLEQMRNLSPYITVRNIGEEPIDEIRLAVDLFSHHLPANDDDLKRWDVLIPLRIHYGDKEDIQLGRKLLPGHAATISLPRYLVPSMLKFQSNARGSNCNQGMFSVSCYAKILGTTAFDDAEKNGRTSFECEWEPKGFSEEKCKKFIADAATEPHISK
jgi:hypothetical protein